MESLVQTYITISQQISSIRDKIGKAEQGISDIKSTCQGDIPARVENLKAQIEKIDEYVLKIRAFQELAKKNLESQNVSTIEAPPGYRVNLNRLRNWSMMIDPTSSNDPYAQRVFVVAKCDECFLKKKRKEFTDRITELESNESKALSREMARLENTVKALYKELKALALGDDMVSFAKMVVEENQKHWFDVSPTSYSNCTDLPISFAPGAYAAPLSFEKEQVKQLKNQFGRFLDAENGRVLLPAVIPLDREFVMAITCTPSKSKQLDKGLQNLVLSIIDKYPAGMQKVYVIDGVRYNSGSMGSLKQLEGTFAMEYIPRNPDQLTSALEQIVSSFSDMDDILELCDSVDEYNRKVDKTKQLPLTTMILYGWPNSYVGRDKELIQRIMTNYERYGVSFITVSYRASEKSDSGSSEIELPEYAMHNAIQISMKTPATTICFPEQSPQRFVWYSFTEELTGDYAATVKENTTKKKTIGNEYIKRYSITNLPTYTREYKKIELPFGIDGKDAAHSVSFENENFATYLVGASRSGKSTLLHTLIAGIIRNYHPDNVELWLADFKQLEFKRYIKHLPPHVKYILLDESPELVYDLIDKLTAEMMERQRLFSRLGKQRLDQIDTSTLQKPLPVIFVILDEFSIMSQAIAESQTYRLRLQNILAKGAALGFRFLLSSQTFTTGVAGLTPTARAQIQQRISMKGSKEEITETLELSTNLKTEQVKNWIDALPPHYALIKFRTGADTLPQVKRLLVMYFKDYAPRDKMIDLVNSAMYTSDTYEPRSMLSYTNKHPVLVDGNSYEAFRKAEFIKCIQALKSSPTSDLAGDEMFLSFGTPRLMTRIKTAVLSSETIENILLIGRAAEQACCASVLLSAMKEYALQGGTVQIWAYGKNKLFKAYKSTFRECGFELIEGIDDISIEIQKVKQTIQNRETDNKLIVLIGMDRICADFAFVDDTVTGAPKLTSFEEKEKKRLEELKQSGALVVTDADEEKRQFGLRIVTARRKAKEEGKSAEETEEIIAKIKDEYIQWQKNSAKPVTKPVAAAPEDNKNAGEASESEPNPTKAYNAQEDFLYVVRQGSRFGYHFFLYLNSVVDIKQTALRPELFRHKLSFQISADDSRLLFNSKSASTLPEHICQYDDSLERYSFRPYLHKNVGWEGWLVSENNEVINPYEEIT